MNERACARIILAVVSLRKPFLPFERAVKTLQIQWQASLTN